jgi:hypothetical protein
VKVLINISLSYGVNTLTEQAKERMNQFPALAFIINQPYRGQWRFGPGPFSGIALALDVPSYVGLNGPRSFPRIEVVLKPDGEKPAHVS